MSAERIPSSAQNNTSGQGKDAVLPEELGGLNWPAFFLHFIWGIGNKTYIALLMFIPFVNLVMPFILLFKGNKWAWANKSWDNVDHFRRVQRKWATATLIIIPVLFFAGGGGFYYGIEQAKTSEPYLASLKQVRQHPQAVKIMGLPITPGWMVTG
ncbi:MAG: hypothetical protein HN719_11720, partial [Alphaproteobacteria bacterium]|nr:hypothetical protein [Alphaproteobacteria bacterium]